MARTAPDGGSAVGIWGPEFDDGSIACHLCGEPIEQEDVSVEAFELTGDITCTCCAEAQAEREAERFWEV